MLVLCAHTGPTHLRKRDNCWSVRSPNETCVKGPAYLFNFFGHDALGMTVNKPNKLRHCNSENGFWVFHKFMKVFFRGFWDSHVNDRWNARYNMILSSYFLYFLSTWLWWWSSSPVFLVSDKQKFPIYSTSIPTNGNLLSDGSSLVKFMDGWHLLSVDKKSSAAGTFFFIANV